MKEPSSPDTPEFGPNSLPRFLSISDNDVEPRTSRVINEAEKILPGVRVALVYPKKEGRIAELHQAGFRVLRWSDLRKDQRKKFENLLPYVVDDQLHYADCILMGARQEVYQERERHKAALRDQRNRKNIDGESAAGLSRDLGMPVTDKW